MRPRGFRTFCTILASLCVLHAQSANSADSTEPAADPVIDSLENVAESIAADTQEVDTSVIVDSSYIDAIIEAMGDGVKKVYPSEEGPRAKLRKAV